MLDRRINIHTHWAFDKPEVVIGEKGSWEITMRPNNSIAANTVCNGCNISAWGQCTKNKSSESEYCPREISYNPYTIHEQVIKNIAELPSYCNCINSISD